MNPSPPPAPRLANYLLLHGIVLIASLTGPLGQLISIGSLPLVWYRMLIAVAAIGVYTAMTGLPMRLPRRGVLLAALTGMIVALHWLAFFESIKRSTVSVCLVCLSTGSLFTSIFEPMVYRRAPRLYEILLGLATVGGVVLVFRFETEYTAGIVIGLTSAGLGALFTVFNGRLVAAYDSRALGLHELAMGALLVTVVLFGVQRPAAAEVTPGWADVGYLLVLGVLCTAVGFVGSIHVMRSVSPFTFILALNLEPVYGILLALLIFGESEFMSPGFYLGAAVILLTLWADAIIKRRARRVPGIDDTGDHGNPSLS